MQKNQTKKAALYIRVSTHYQIDKDSLPFQRNELINYAKYALGIDDYAIFEDAGYSGKNTDRPAYQDMMRRIRAKEFSHLCVWKIDRISRNLLDFAAMYEELKKFNCTFVSKNEQFDTSSAIGEAMLRIILVFAELERKLTAERVTSIMYSRANKGLWNGVPIPLGYKWDAKGKYPVIDEDTAVVVRYIYDQYERIHSTMKLSDKLNRENIKSARGGEWTGTTVKGILRNPFYKGTYRYNYKTQTGRIKPVEEQIVHEDNHPGIIDKEQWDRVNKILDENSTRSVAQLRSNVKYTHIFSKLLRCGQCGHTMGGGLDRARSDGYRPSRYYCTSHTRKAGCTNGVYSDVYLGPFVFNYIATLVRAQRALTDTQKPRDLERMLLRGKFFDSVAGIEQQGLLDTYNTILYGSGEDVMLQPSPEIAAQSASELELLDRDQKKYERALERIEQLYLYSEESMPEKDYVLKRNELKAMLDNIAERRAEVNSRLGLAPASSDFLEKATYFYLTNSLNQKRSLDFRKMVDTFEPKMLQDFLCSVIDHITVVDGHVASISFKNGLTNKFIYKATKSPKNASTKP